MTTINIIRGDDVTKNIYVKDNDGVAIDITGWTVFFTVKPKVDNITTDSSALIQKTITSHTDPTNGETQIVLTDDDTNIDIGNYFYDIQFKTVTGAIKTPSEYPARFNVIGDVTRRTE